MKRIVHLSFIDYFADLGELTSPGHYTVSITSANEVVPNSPELSSDVSKTANEVVPNSSELSSDVSKTANDINHKKGLPIDYFILPDGLCINTEGNVEKIVSVYYILKKPSPEGIVPFIQDIVAFCNDVSIKAIDPEVIELLVPKWKENLNDKLLDEIPQWCEKLKGKTLDDITDLKQVCKPNFDFGEDVISYRGEAQDDLLATPVTLISK